MFIPYGSLVGSSSVPNESMLNTSLTFNPAMPLVDSSPLFTALIIFCTGDRFFKNSNPPPTLSAIDPSPSVILLPIVSLTPLDAGAWSYSFKLPIPISKRSWKSSLDALV